MRIHGFSQLTLLDYPGKLACTIFCGSCNFRCPFCHNATLVLHPDSEPAIDEDTIVDTLMKRNNMLEGICVTGGEPTIYKDLPGFIGRLKETGYAIKLDTNGTNPDMLNELINDGLIDCVAMDIKASPDNYAKATGIEAPPMDSIFKSVEILMSGRVNYEFRTTVVNGIHTAEDFRVIGSWLRGARAYYLQRYIDSGNLINAAGLRPASKSTMTGYRNILLPDIPNTYLRGVD